MEKRRRTRARDSTSGAAQKPRAQPAGSDPSPNEERSTVLADTEIARVSSAIKQRLQVLSIQEVAEIFGRSPRTIRDWIHSGKLRAIRVGRMPFVSLAEMEALLARGRDQ